MQSTGHDHEEFKESNFIVKFFKFIWNLFKGYFMMVGLLVTLMPVMLIILLSRSDTQIEMPVAAEIKDPSVIRVKLDGNLAEKQPNPSLSFFMRLLGESNDLYAPNFSRAMEYAAKDQRVKAIYVDVQRIAGSMAQLSELRRAFKQVKDAGKPLYFQLTNLDNASYYLASLGKEINLTPAGSVSLTGPVLSLMYFADGLSKLGVEFEVFQAGKYKSAMENLVLNAPSDAAREMYASIEENMRLQMVEDIASARGVEVSLVRGWMAQSIFIPSDAKQAGMITSLSYENEFSDMIKKEHNVEDYVSFADYNSATSEMIDDQEIGPENEKIALIEAVGEIHMFSDGNNEDVITPGKMNKQLDWALEENDIKAVVLRISSPGGSATASDMIWNRVRRLAQKKPVVVSMMGYAASGGYYIASGGNKILSEPSTITGSIGVIGALANLTAFKDKYGVSFHTFTGSERESLLNPSQKLNAFDRALMEANIMSTYKDFLDRVAKGRQMTVEEVHKIAQGRVWTGRQALENGLVDELGGYQDAFKYAKEMAGLDPKKKYRIASYTGDELSFRECLKSSRNLFKCLQEAESSLNLSSLIKEANLPGTDIGMSKVKRWFDYVEAKKPLTLLPFTPQVR